MPTPQRRKAHELVERGELHCLKDLGGCGTLWDPSRCFHCNLDLGEEAPATCPKCSRPTYLGSCPKCGKTESTRLLTLAEALGLAAEGEECAACGLPRSTAGKRTSTCPDCGGTWIDSYPQRPELDAGLDLPSPHGPIVLSLIYAAEGRIAKDENGVPLDTCLATWMERHGIEDPEEADVWEDLIHAVAEGHRRGIAARWERERAAREAD